MGGHSGQMPDGPDGWTLRPNALWTGWVDTQAKCLMNRMGGHSDQMPDGPDGWTLRPNA
ncbi:MAG: hypothetical protein GY775_18610 [Candidatus Scalindua sp.]|nr:hypothetical protein [Candidatus Scalindua sp.]